MWERSAVPRPNAHMIPFAVYPQGPGGTKYPFVREERG